MDAKVSQQTPAGLAAAPVSDSEAGYPPASHGWYIVLALTVSYALSYLDRNVLSLLIEAIKRDLHLTDTQVSLLSGLAFICLFATGGLIFGRLVDSQRRLSVAAGGIAFWSLMTAGCGLVSSYAGIFLCRVGVGAGEAALAPAAYSLVADCFSPRRRGFALASYSVGIYAGQGLALIVGAVILGIVMKWGTITLPVVGHIYNWQLIFLAISLLGLPVALWVMSIREPERHGVLHRATGADGSISVGKLPVREVLVYYGANLRSMICLNLCHALVAMAIVAINTWVPAFFIRTYHLTAMEVGRTYGIIVIVFGTLGVLTGGALGDFVRVRGLRNGRVMVQAATGLLTFPFAIAFPLAGSATASYLLLIPMTFFATFTVATHTPALLEMVPNQMRGVTGAITLLVSNLLGIGLGPTSVALVTNYVIHDEHLIRYSLAIVPPLAFLLSSGFGLATIRPYLRSLDYEERWNAAESLAADSNADR